MDMLIFVGLQASGKSTFYRTHFSATHAYISKDLLRNNKRPARRQQQLIEDALQSGRSIVVDNTNPTREDRAPLIVLGHQYAAQVIGYYFEVQLKRSIERNNLRTGKERVPPVAIFTTLKKLTLPMLEEGFDQLYCVRSKDDFEFEILPWPEEKSGGSVANHTSC